MYVNEDGNVTITDFLQVKSYLLGNITFSNQGLMNGDVNNDGVIDTIDQDLINQYLLGTITGFPYQPYTE